jgi:large subunit ribosomal protein L32
MVVRMRSTRAHRNNRRSHHALKSPALSKCECGALQKRHQVCEQCGKYRGRQVIDIVARAERVVARAKNKAKNARDAGEAEKAEKKAEEATKKSS